MNDPKIIKIINKAKLHLATQRNTTFFSSLIANMRLIISRDVPTAGTNGIDIVFNPDFLEKQTTPQVIGLMLHEVFHTVYQHLDRQKTLNLDKNIWNMAGDYFINNQLDKLGYKLPEGGLMDHKYGKKGTKEIYDELIKNVEYIEIPQELMDLDFDIPEGMSELEHAERVISNTIKAVTQARLANDPGSIPDDIARRVEQVLNPVLPWNVILMNHMNAYAQDEYTWRRPNRRFLPDYYLPSLFSESLGQITIAIDVSGSIDQGDLDSFMAEIRYIWDTLHPKKMRIMGFDTKIHDDLEFFQGDSIEDISLSGGGGTNPQPVINTLVKDAPEIAIIFSDGEFHTPEMGNVTSALFWVIKGDEDFTIPVGEVIHYECK